MRVLANARAVTQVERYAVYDEFAKGGMATVHFARLLGAQGFRRTVAAKRLLPHLTRDQEFTLMLVDEARLAARVRHPNVVATLDVVQTEYELLVVMDYVHGDSLAALIQAAHERSERVPLPIAAAIVTDVLHGLHAAHESKDERGVLLGLVHRDVSPHNVLVGLDGIARIADFGIAKATERAHATREGSIKGKLAYMAPEQLNGAGVGRTTDVFAAAVVLWELLAGERLFAAQSHAETMFKVVSAPIPSLAQRGAKLPPELESIVMRGLERNPTKRFPTAQAMALALEANVPSVRPSAIAEWVERTIGDRLSRRSDLLYEIEREDLANKWAPEDPSYLQRAPPHVDLLAPGCEDRALEREPTAAALARPSAVESHSPKARSTWFRALRFALPASLILAVAAITYALSPAKPRRATTVPAQLPIQTAAPAQPLAEAAKERPPLPAAALQTASFSDDVLQAPPANESAAPSSTQQDISAIANDSRSAKLPPPKKHCPEYVRDAATNRVRFQLDCLLPSTPP